MRSYRFATFVVCLSLAGFGCGGTDRHGVSGTVNWRGRPVAAGTILFLRPGSPGPAAGAAIRDGAFEVPAKQGLLPGSYKVSVSAAEAAGPTPATDAAPGDTAAFRETLPAKYNADTELTFEVTAGDSRLTLDLK